MMTNRQTLISLIAAALIAGSAAQAADAEKQLPADYDTCLDLVAQAPETGFNYAQKWIQNAGQDTLAARHCQAVALSSMGRYDEAATALSEVALSMEDAPKEARGEAFAQVADAWMLAGNETRARVAIDQALALDPITTYLLVRADIRASQNDWEGAREDASAVLADLPTSPDALTLRATASRNLGHAQSALADATRAVDIAPHNMSALLERGRTKAALLDMPGARADWQSVIDVARDMGRDRDPRAVAAAAFLKGGTGE
ncbi:MAG: hypothetical protein Q7S99_13885 [Parvibaculum sp.]|nr:hypothetical protein [Parvibaculum sp.]